jgi:hypothetical protein
LTLRATNGAIATIVRLDMRCSNGVAHMGDRSLLR